MTATDALAKQLSNGEVEHDCKYNISNSLPSWWKGPDRELPPYHFSISDGSRFVIVSIAGIESTEAFRAALEEFDLEDVYSRATGRGAGVQKLKRR